LGLARWVGRAIGLDVHRDFCVVAICEGGKTRSAGRVPSTPDGIAALAESLLPTDRVALEVTGSCWEVARILEPHVQRVVIVIPGSHCPPRACHWSNSPASVSDTLILRPFRGPWVTWTARSSPRWTLQNGLARAPETFGSFILGQVAVGHFGHEAGADLVGDADSPGRVWGCLFGWEQARVDPPVDRAVGHA
jgi:hypothetical protein